MPYGTVNADLMTTSDGVSSSGLYGFKNRIYNGQMVIDQRNAGASVTPASGTYTLDRWFANIAQSSKFSVQQTPSATETGFAVRVAAGFTNYLATTSTSAYSVLTADYFSMYQIIEGNNISDLAWGTASAKTVTLSFYVRSSLTGTFGGALNNSGFTRSYPFSYSISVANTWEQKTITVAGDTSGTWLTTNGIGMVVSLSLGAGSTYSGTANAWAGSTLTQPTGATSVVGTNGATFYITGVQLEKGSTATSFDYRPYGTELALCQRYLPAFISTANLDYVPFWSAGATSTSGSGMYKFDVPTRVPPTGITISAASDFRITRPSTGNILCTALSFAQASCYAGSFSWTVASGASADQPYGMYATSSSAKILWTGCEL